MLKNYENRGTRIKVTGSDMASSDTDMNNRANPSDITVGRTGKAVLGILLVIVCLIAAPVIGARGLISDQQGPHQVQTVDTLELNDTSRNRTVPIKVYYPSEKGIYPVIIFSHGLGGSKNTKVYISRFLTSYGYVCIHLTHYGSDSSLIDHNLSWKENVRNLKKAVKNRKHLVDRPMDVSFVIDQLPEIARRVPELKNKMDLKNLGVTGHSFGAFTTLMVAGAYADMSEKIYGRRFDDPRPTAFLAMSPQSARPGRDRVKIYSHITRPFMTMTGSRDLSPVDRIKHPEERLVPFKNMPPGDKYALWIDGANHWTFGDGRVINTGGEKKALKPDPARHRIIKQVSLAFWNAYLKGDSEARKFLISGEISRTSGGMARIDFR